jgi:hypothetical protein
MSKKIWFFLRNRREAVLLFPRSAVTVIESASNHTEQEAGTEPVAGHFSAHFSGSFGQSCGTLADGFVSSPFVREKKCVHSTNMD